VLATTSATFSFVDERQFLTVIQPVLPLHECADHAPVEFAAKPLHSVTDSTAAEEATANSVSIESVVEPLHSAADPASSGATLTETFFYVFKFESLA
jgi:hypothetical protein